VSVADELLLNIAATMGKSRANGPGIRAVIWVQGCTIGCPGCYNAFTHPHEAASLHSPKQVAEWILSIDGIEGITFSGGEPFEQAAAITEVVKNVLNEKPFLTVFIFSGFEFIDLESNTHTAVKELLSLTDLLSSGPYVLKLRDESLLWRGSSNQELRYLSQRYNSDLEYEWLKNSPFEEYTIQEEQIQFTGFGGVFSENLKAVVEELA
jgi:anaerobic ribonucleoside-triphosphate reductase activating protein